MRPPSPLEETTSTIIIHRPLARGAIIAAAPGQRVLPDTPLASLELENGALRRIDVARSLACDPADLSEYLMVSPGDRVTRDRPLAARVLFETPRVVTSPHRGRVAFVSSRLGYVYIREIPPDPGGPVVIDLSASLGLPRNVCRHHLRVRAGQRVLYGQILAARWSTYQTAAHFLAPVSGTVASVSDDGSVVTLQPSPSWSTVRALVPGTVSEVRAGRHVAIAVAGRRESGVFGVRGPVCGRLLVARDAPGTARPGPKEDEGPSGRVVLLATPPRAVDLRAWEAAGAVGVIAPVMDQLELVSYLGHEIRLGITGGAEGTGMAVVLLEGFASAPEASSDAPRPEVWQRLAERSGEHVYLDGRTHIRAGARRPEMVIVPDPDVADAGLSAPGMFGPNPGAPALGVTSPDPSDARASGPGASDRAEPAEAWAYPVCFPRDGPSFLRRFPGAPSPRVEAYPASSARAAFAGLPLLAGKTASDIGALAREVAGSAGPRIEKVFAPRSAGDRGGPPAVLSPVLLFGGFLPAALRRAEEADGLWATRSPAERECPGFVATGEVAASFSRGVPSASGHAFLVLVGPSYGWGPWHLEALSRGDVAVTMDSLDEEGWVRRVSHGFTILGALRIIKTGLGQTRGPVLSSVVRAADVAGMAEDLTRAARSLAAVLTPFRPEMEALLRELGGAAARADGPAARANGAADTAGTASGRGVLPGLGDLREAFYACLAEALVMEARRRGALPRPVTPLPLAEALLGGKWVWLDTQHSAGATYTVRSGSWPLDDHPRPLDASATPFRRGVRTRGDGRD